ncbi:unnamed protein product, partial [Nesidiocoris tenuis]
MDAQNCCSIGNKWITREMMTAARRVGSSERANSQTTVRTAFFQGRRFLNRYRRQFGRIRRHAPHTGYKIETQIQVKLKVGLKLKVNLKFKVNLKLKFFLGKHSTLSEPENGF